MGSDTTMGDMGRNIGVRLRHARRLRGLSQEKLAKQAGVTQAAISQLEKGESKSFKGSTLISLAHHLQVNPAWLAEGKGQMDGSEPPLPLEAVKFAREWLKLVPEARVKVAELVATMIETSAADTPAVEDERVAAAYGKPGRSKK
jgi:transcriptional regulator with XRE-family HTH domain